MKKKPQSRTWTAKDDARLLRLWNQGLSAPKIAGHFSGRTFYAVHRHLFRLLKRKS